MAEIKNKFLFYGGKEMENNYVFFVAIGIFSLIVGFLNSKGRRSGSSALLGTVWGFAYALYLVAFVVLAIITATYRLDAYQQEWGGISDIQMMSKRLLILTVWAVYPWLCKLIGSSLSNKV